MLAEQRENYVVGFQNDQQLGTAEPATSETKDRLAGKTSSPSALQHFLQYHDDDSNVSSNFYASHNAKLL